MGQIITVSGALGSGKSTVSHILVDRLGFIYYSTGIVQRHIAERRGVTTLELNRLAATDKSIDRQIDSAFADLVHTGKNYVVDSRLGFFFIPSSFKVMLKVDLQAAGARVFHDETRIGEKKYASVDEAVAALSARRRLERERFLSVYGVDIDDESLFDVVVDTTHISPETVADRILKQLP